MIATPLELAADSDAAGLEALFEKVAAEFAAPLTRLARAHEVDTHLQQDLLQEIHIALWRSLAAFGGRCSLRTWVFRVAHNVAGTHVMRNRRRQAHRLTALDDIELAGAIPDVDAELDEERAMQKINALIHALKPLDRQVIILHLEGLAADEIADIAGISPAHTYTKLTRIRQLLAAQIGAGENT
ncbi:MAG: sigma-70 family RNA polymerase sigma factor [Steroidobacteraceae bacterium]|nr:sigma-70 family RNA polymerase sigma factor [Steroidobacteraceae bacterium]